jgi:hypothetical protein
MLQARRDRFEETGTIQGVSSMQIAIATMLQTNPNQAAQPLYADNTSIWHHMSDALHQSLDRVLSLLIAILPGILAFVVALVVLTLLGMALSAVLRWVLTAARFDERLARGRGNLDWAPSTSPSALVARGSFWACVILGLPVHCFLSWPMSSVRSFCSSPAI